ncbi:hypothetical protein ACN28S_27620 [Cystobacter fuscus]
MNTPGTYFFRIQPGGSTVGAYTYRLQDLGVDDHGDTLATATPITPGTSGVPAQFEVSRDEDWFSFTATAGRLYDFTCSTASIDCDVYLLDAHGNVVAADTTSTTVTRVRGKFTTGGTFYYRVVASSGWNVSYTSYTYRLQDLGVDDHGDTLATATPITPSASWVPAQFEVSRDEDWFSFIATAGRLYEFSCSTASIDCDLYLLDSEEGDCGEHHVHVHDAGALEAHHRRDVLLPGLGRQRLERLVHELFVPVAGSGRGVVPRTTEATGRSGFNTDAATPPKPMNLARLPRAWFLLRATQNGLRGGGGSASAAE